MYLCHPLALILLHLRRQVISEHSYIYNNPFTDSPMWKTTTFTASRISRSSLCVLHIARSWPEELAPKFPILFPSCELRTSNFKIYLLKLHIYVFVILCGNRAKVAVVYVSGRGKRASHIFLGGGMSRKWLQNLAILLQCGDNNLDKRSIIVKFWSLNTRLLSALIKNTVIWVAHFALNACFSSAAYYVMHNELCICLIFKPLVLFWLVYSRYNDCYHSMLLWSI